MKYMSNIYKSIEQSPPREANNSLSSQEFGSQETTSYLFPMPNESRTHPSCLRYILILSSSVCEIFPGGKGGWCVELTTLPPSCANCLEIWEPQPPGTLRASPGLWCGWKDYVNEKFQ
jgi:hypothetical protein